jgi:S-adenosyl methyltransferase
MDDARRDPDSSDHLTVAGTYAHIVGSDDSTLTDRRAVDAFTRRWPGVAENAVENARFERRVVPWLAKQGIRQILNLGSGRPKPNGNVHQILAEETGDGRVVYVEHDPTAHAHAQAMWGSGPAYIEADVADADRVLTEVRDRNLLDLGEPVGVLLLAVLPYVDAAPAAVVAPYAAAVPSGSLLAITHMASDGAPQEMLDDLARTFEPAGGIFIRPRDVIEAAWQGWPLVEPGVVDVRDWRPDGDAAERGPLPMLGGVARKP